ncbi:MAG: hydrolase [Anaerocolumna sp.]|nr:hydrolase [Anaerocolumna sp.]
MINVSFYNENEIQDELLKFAVIAARYQEKWIFCRHKERVTWEIPGGHREVGEDILDTARRELYEETGAIYFQARL